MRSITHKPNPGVEPAPETKTRLRLPLVRCLRPGCSNDPVTPTGTFRCSRCGDLLELDPPAATAESANWPRIWAERRLSTRDADLSGVWRYRELFPFSLDDTEPVTLREGNTPLYTAARCARYAGVKNLWLKHQGMNPTGSFKDAGMTVSVTVARGLGSQWVACASTGNTSASMAAYAARAGLHSLVLLPEGKITWSKLAQALDYGAFVYQVDTDFDGCVRILNELVERRGFYLLNSVNPYRLEGQKTVAVELMEQFQWDPPDHVILPGGNLANSSAVGRGLLQLKALGLLPRLPAVSIIQAEGANPFYRMLQSGKQELVAMEAETLATAIRIGNPASWRRALHVLRETGGFCEQVTEGEIAEAKGEIGSEGIGCEPASAVTLAGLKKLVTAGRIKANERTVLVLTGHVLKDPQYAIDFHRGELEFKGKLVRRTGHTVETYPPSGDAVLRALDDWRESHQDWAD